MSGYFDEADLERVRQAIDIAELIGGYVSLKRRGQGDYWGQCPFHSEKSASFHVRSDRGMFHCFGCGKGGNVFSFLMEVERLSFNEAVRFLAEKAGVPLPERVSGPGAAASSERERLFVANSVAERWFHERLAKALRSREAEKALEYLLGRGINLEIINRFKIGFAEADWEGLVKFASRSGVAGDALAEAGLASRRKDGSGFVDRFRTRVMFPIQSLSGKAVAFGGRRIEGITPEDDQAKYVNSPETSIYRKGEHLYGLYTAREEIRRTQTAYLVEGYIDLLALVQAGILNGVASLGTSLTENQAKLIGRFTSRVVVVYDGDSAGINAAIRAADVLTLAGIEVRMAPLPEGEDPDSVLRKEGAEALKENLGKNQSFVQFRLGAAGARRNMGQAELLTVSRGLLETIRSVRDALQRDLLISELSDRTGLRREALDSVARVGRPRADELPPTKEGLIVAPDEVSERDLLKDLIGSPFLIPEAMESVSPDLFSNPLLKSLYLALEEAYLSGGVTNVAALSDRIADPMLKAFVAEAALARENVDPEKAREGVRDCIKTLMRRELLKRRTELKNLLQQAHDSGAESRPIILELIDLDRRLNSLQ